MKEEHRHKYHEPQTAHFFKIILNDTLGSGKLSIPKSFVRRHGRSLCLSKVYLRVSAGDVWEVELREEDDGYMWLLHGWQDFVEFYNIKFGYFLVFGYLGNSEFQVQIFDKTTLEIKYPCKSKKNKEHDADVDPCLFSVEPEIEENDAETSVNHNASKNKKRKGNTNSSRKGSRDSANVNGGLGISKGNFNENPEAIIRTKGFNSPNPCFRMIMRSSYVTGKYILHMPGTFMVDHIGHKDRYLKLSVPCGRSWTVKCRIRMNGNESAAKIQKGWRPFVKDNNLVAGDACVFELIDSVEAHFRVTTFSAAADPGSRDCNGGQVSPKPPCHKASSSEIQNATTSNHTSKNNPSFKLVMTEARTRYSRVPIPTGFLKHLKPNAQILTLEVAGRLWHAKVYHFNSRRPGREAVMSYGWSKFAKDNSLQVGDVCIFELIESEEMVLKVSIHKGSM